MAGFEWAKLAVNFHSNPKTVGAGRNGRDVYIWALCRHAECGHGGRVARGFFEPRYLGRMLDITAKQAHEGLARCEAVDLLRIDGDHVVIVGWNDEEWGTPSGGAERTRKWRSRKRSADHGDVTVTAASHPPSQPCTVVTLGDKGDVVEKSREEKRESQAPPGPESDFDLAEGTGTGDRKRKRPKSRLPASWTPSPAHAAIADDNHVNLTRELAKFRDWAEANGALKADWDAAFRGWLRRAGEFGGVNGKKPSGSKTVAQLLDEANAGQT